MTWITAISIALPILTIITLLPQLLKIYRTKQVRDISLVTFSLIAIAATLWIVYGIYRDDWVVSLTNVFILVFASLIVMAKLRYRDNDSQKKSNRGEL